MTSTSSANRKSKRDDPKRSSAPTTVVVGSEQQMTKVKLTTFLINFSSICSFILQIKNPVKTNDAVVLTQTASTINNNNINNNKKRRATEIIQNEVRY